MVDDLFHFPALRSEHIGRAAFFANREDMVRHLAHPAANIAEIGVALGDFSSVLMEAYRPELFVAFDMFTMHTFEKVWFVPSEEIFQGKTHIEYYRDRFKDAPCQVKTEVGLSQDLLARYPDHHFDMIYVDGDHHPEPVQRDAELASRKVKPNGTLIFNDYILFDPFAGEGSRYGVVQAVNRLCVDQGWKVVGFALHHLLFCDIALRRA
jgi:hypothetical protein